MKINLIYMIIYFTILVTVILLSFYIIEIISFIFRLPIIDSIFGEFRDYVLGMKQPLMILPNVAYRVVNLYPLHVAYYVYLFWVTLLLIIIVLLWLIGTIIQKIIFFNPFAAIPPWAELNEMGFFVWLFEKTGIEKRVDIQNFVLNIFKSLLTPEEFEAAQQRCQENFVDNVEHIDYDLSDKYREERIDDTFYTKSYISIKHNDEANKYRKMKIARPDEDDLLMPDIDIESTMKTNMNYMYI